MKCRKLSTAPPVPTSTAPLPLLPPRLLLSGVPPPRSPLHAAFPPALCAQSPPDAAKSSGTTLRASPPRSPLSVRDRPVPLRPGQILSLLHTFLPGVSGEFKARSSAAPFPLLPEAALPPDSDVLYGLGFLVRWGTLDLVVVVRIRPPCRVAKEEEAEEDARALDFCKRKAATNSVAIQGQDFTFDAVADEVSSQVSEIGGDFGVNFCTRRPFDEPIQVDLLNLGDF
uniref:Uncharacterized protein n=1 Tax=Oryza meridionalis TaxID=40149 RepID=A0A0E0EFQ2_9ORYZ